MNTVLWRRLDMPGHERARLERRADGWALSGTALFVHEERPVQLDYSVVCDAAWSTRSAVVRGAIGDRAVDLSVVADESSRWWQDGSERPAVEGCTDIDLGFSPSTNLLPIRRLSLAVGEEAGVLAAWLPFPGFVLEPLPQTYRREKGEIYRYESRGGRFTRNLQVVDSGFVVLYPGIWEAVATS